MSLHNLEPDAERVRLGTLLEAERTRHDQLAEALSDFRHADRRMGDRLERVGGRDADLEQQRSLLSENLKLTAAELAKSEARINEIRRKLEDFAAD